MPSGRARTSIVIVDDHRAFGEALALALRKERDLDVVAVSTDGQSAIEIIAETRPDVVLLDLQMPGVDGLQVSSQIREASEKTSIIILTGASDALAHGRAVQAGAHGFLEKTAAIGEIAEAVRRARRGEALNPPEEVEAALERVSRTRRREGDMGSRLDRLTPRELEILRALADGRTADEIVSDLGVTRNTLRTHVQNILMKLGVHSKLDAIVAAIRHGKVRTTTLTDVDPLSETEPVSNEG